MLPDSHALRGAATIVGSLAGGVNGERSRSWLQARGTLWRAPAAERIKGEISDHDALARTASDELHAAAMHLRRLAEAIDTLRERMRSAHAQHIQALQTELSTARRDPAGSGVTTMLQTELGSVAGPDDPYWSTRVEVPSAPLPTVSGAATIPLATMGPYVGVDIDTAAVRRLGDTVGALSQHLLAARGRASAAVSALPLAQLDRYGLPGRAAGGFLADVTGSGSSLARAASGYDMDARRTACLAGLVERADEAGLTALDVLGDARAGRAVDLAALLTTGADTDTVWGAAESLSPEDLAWLMSVVPELEAALGAKTDGDGLPFTWVDGVDWLTGITGGPRAVADSAAAAAAARGVDAKAIKPVHGSTQAQRAAYREAIRLMRLSRREAARFSAISARVPGNSVLARLNTPIMRATPVLRNIPVLSVLMTGVGTAADVRKGMSPEGAVAKNVTSTAAGLGAAALTTAGFVAAGATATAAAPVLAAVAVGAAVSFGTGKLIEHYGDDVVDFGADVGSGAVDLGEDAWDWAFG